MLLHIFSVISRNCTPALQLLHTVSLASGLGLAGNYCQGRTNDATSIVKTQGPISINFAM